MVHYEQGKFFWCFDLQTEQNKTCTILQQCTRNNKRHFLMSFIQSLLATRTNDKYYSSGGTILPRISSPKPARCSFGSLLQRQSRCLQIGNLSRSKVPAQHLTRALIRNEHHLPDVNA